MRHDRVRCLVLTGCTAVGKSMLAMKVAERRSAEIISADSVAVYRGLDLGSAKPSRLWRQYVPHHLIDIADPSISLTRPYTAADFARQARDLIHEISDRGHLPIICGGSGMYLSFLIHGHDQSDWNKSRPDSITNEVVNSALSSSENWDQAIDLIAQRLHLNSEHLRHVQPGNRRRLIRTAYRFRSPPPPPPPSSSSLSNTTILADDIDFRSFVLIRPRPVLYRSIDLRCEMMLQSGLIDEVHGLSKSGQLPAGSPPALAVGYRQSLDYLHTLRSMSDQFDRAQFRVFLNEFQTASRQLARRQLTWFRNDPALRFMDADRDHDDIGRMVDDVLFQYDLDRADYEALAHTDEFRSDQDRLRHLSDEDRLRQRLYVSDPVIFKHGMNDDLILKLMAQHVSSL